MKINDLNPLDYDEFRVLFCFNKNIGRIEFRNRDNSVHKCRLVVWKAKKEIFKIKFKVFLLGNNT
jgi:hypothetical protein